MAIMLRLKCPSCGEVMNAAGFCNCTKCGTPIRYNGWGMLQIYRMGSPVSIAAGYGIYLDGQPTAIWPTRRASAFRSRWGRTRCT